MKDDPPLALDSRFTHLVGSRDGAVLVGEEDFVLLDRPLVEDVVRLVDGSRSATDIVRRARDHPPEEVHYALILLEEEGVLRPVDRALSAPSAPDRDAGLSEAASRLREGWAGRAAGRAAIALALSRDVRLVLTEDYLHRHVTALVEAVVGRGETALLARLGAGSIWVGPLVRPGRPPCISCLTGRLRLNLPARTLLHAAAGERACRVEPLGRRLPSRAFEVLARLAGEAANGEAFERRLRVEPLDGAGGSEHAVVALADCPGCGDRALGVPGAAVRIGSRMKQAGSGGGFRTVTPDETWRRVRPFVDRVTGVVRAVRRIPAAECPAVHVYSASHAHHYGRARVRDLREETRDHSGGKGWTDLDARVSAVCESLERFSSVHRGGEPVRRSRLAELGTDAIPPNDLLHFSDRQLQGREAWNQGRGRDFQRIPEPYDGQPIEWSPTRSLVTDRVRWIPTAFIYYGHRGHGGRYCDGDSNGLASGNCVEEAVLQGFLELVERDAVALWWYNRLSRRGVDLDALDDPWTEQIRAFYGSLGRTLWALDLTTDLGIPVIVALSERDGGEIAFGFGCHLDASLAVRRALTEVNQMMTSVLLAPDERERRLRPAYPDALDWWAHATLETDPHLRASGAAPLRPATVEAPASEDLADDIAACVRRAAGAGLDVLVHDLTRPDVGFPVVKVVAPGLRHFWRRLGPGRLYDVP
ncbi:MAG TPA: TOMM precursor leader peptide-binding protein, partial [Longimicrobiales bacterium]|nr:TOMM precursor leader peptide-binding protein [Longimicrobiales bacterium]